LKVLQAKKLKDKNSLMGAGKRGHEQLSCTAGLKVKKTPALSGGTISTADSTP
jgi:hypothetical protein